MKKETGFTTCLGLSIALLSACGMTNKPSSQAATEVTAAKANLGQTSQSSRYYAHAAITSNDEGTLTPCLGDNNYVFRFVQVKDLTPLPATTTVKVAYEMPSMPGMGVSRVAATLQADGSFAAKLFYSMSGAWKVTVQIDDPVLPDSKDEYAFSITL